MSPKVPEAKKFDLNNLDTGKAADQGAVLELIHPVENTKLDIRITLAGSDSAVYRKTQNRIANVRTSKISPQRPFIPLTSEEQEENGLEVLAACTLAWEGVMVDGADVECNVRNAKMVYRRFPWIKEQVDAFVANRANFLVG